MNDERWKKAPDGGGEVCWVYISPGFETRGNTKTAATGNLLPIAAVTVYIKVCPPTLFLEELLLLRFGLFPIQILFLKDVHQQEEH